MKTKFTSKDWEVFNSPTGIVYIISDSRDGKDRQTNICCVHSLEDGVNNKERLKESKANAKLIAEAGTVVNETGYTPRQLADQKAELLEALNFIIYKYNGIGMTKQEKLDQMFKIAGKAIKKATE